jgi:hypothetical protein
LTHRFVRVAKGELSVPESVFSRPDCPWGVAAIIG